MNFGKSVRVACAIADNMTQVELAEKAGLPLQHLRNLMSGAQPVRQLHIVAVAQVFGMQASEFIALGEQTIAVSKRS